MGARRKQNNTKNILSKSELRAARKNSFTITKEDEKVAKLEEEQNHFAKLADNLIESKKPENDPVEILMKEVNSEINAEETKEENELTINEKICKEYVDGSTIREIAKKFELNYQKVRSILLKNDVKLRPRGFSSNKNLEVKEETNIVEDEIKFDKDDNILPINNFMFADEEFSNNKIKRFQFNNPDSYSENVFIAGLVRDRHEIPFVDKYIFETLTQANFNTPEYCENKARGFINAYLRPNKESNEHKTLVVYCTGLQLALSALVSVCAQMQINLITMHLNIEQKKYVPQKTLCIFGENIPDVKDLTPNPLKALTDRYDKVYTYNCDIQDLINQGNCSYIKASYGEKFSNDKESVFILFNKDFPDAEQWQIFGDLVKSMQRVDLEDKKHCVILGRISIYADNIKFGENIAKSFNYRNSTNNNR